MSYFDMNSAEFAEEMERGRFNHLLFNDTLGNSNVFEIAEAIEQFEANVFSEVAQ